MSGKHRDPTAKAAMRNMSTSKRMEKALTVAQLAIEMCMEDLRRR